MSLQISRRSFLTVLASAGAGLLPTHCLARAAGSGRLTEPIPGSGEVLPVVGMGTWISFNVGDDPRALDVRTEILRTFFVAGGGMIDSSPMYDPAVTCAIPATSQVAHMHENMDAGVGLLPDAALRRRMAGDFANLS